MRRLPLTTRRAAARSPARRTSARCRLSVSISSTMICAGAGRGLRLSARSGRSGRQGALPKQSAGDEATCLALLVLAPEPAL